MTDRPLPARVYEVLVRVPPGKVVTYGQIALHLGMPRGARAVGWAMHRCPEGLPWYCVLNARGAPAGDPSGERAPLQRRLLEEEGVLFSPDGTVDLARYGWDGI